MAGVPDRPARGQVVDAHPDGAPLVGILALQGGFGAHELNLDALGAHHREVRVPADLEGLDALIVPGGESTTMTLGVQREGLAEPLRALAARGVPILGTCAGLIMLDRDHLGILDVVAERNAFGRQLRSFETALELDGLGGGPINAVFIRAPWVAEYGDAVAVLAVLDGHPVAVREGSVIALAFHPELAGEPRLHQMLLNLVPAARLSTARSRATPPTTTR